MLAYRHGPFATATHFSLHGDSICEIPADALCSHLSSKEGDIVGTAIQNGSVFFSSKTLERSSFKFLRMGEILAQGPVPSVVRFRERNKVASDSCSDLHGCSSITEPMSSEALSNVRKTPSGPPRPSHVTYTHAPLRLRSGSIRSRGSAMHVIVSVCPGKRRRGTRLGRA